MIKDANTEYAVSDDGAIQDIKVRVFVSKKYPNSLLARDSFVKGRSMGIIMPR